jgi:Xaa-Pro aminopeptidase
MDAMLRMIALFALLPFFFFAQETEKTSKTLLTNYGRYDADLLSKEFHAGRRATLRQLMPENSVAVFFASPVRVRSNDVDYLYHQDPNFYYFTGLTEPNALLFVFDKPQNIGGQMLNELIYVQPRNERMELWTGKRLGTSGVEMELGIAKALDNYTFADNNIDLRNFSGGVYYSPIQGDLPYSQNKGELYHLKKRFDEQVADKKVKSNTKELDEWCAELRQTKQPEELTLLIKAIDITCEAHNENMRMMRANQPEYKTQAVVEYIFGLRGAEYTGFPSIIGGGENSCILHYNTNRKSSGSNDLMVCDIGAEYHGYTADITRTLPVNGKFSPEQAIIYNIVLEAQEAGIKECRAGNQFFSAHVAATTVISQRLKELGIIAKPQEVSRYFMHGTSHYLGLDVHDAGTYGPLKPNDVITVEPGIYIPEGSPCDPKWWNIGVRIEDDILITTSDPIILSNKSPRTIEEIEAMMQEEPMFFKK